MLKQLSLAMLLLEASGAAAPSGVTLKVIVPPAITLPTPGKTEVHLELVLTNTASTPVALTGTNECVTHRWAVTDSRGEAVDGRTICPMIYQLQSRTLMPGEWRSGANIEIDAAKYRSGEHYTVHYWLWGVEGTAPFTVVRQ
jgi:hypothetical protein